MNPLSRRQRLRARIDETMARYGRAQAERDRRRRQPPRPGDLFVFAATAEYSLQWAVIDRDPEDEWRFLVVAADLHPMIGSADVAAPAESACGALSLRCRFDAWLGIGDLAPEMRTGFLGSELLDRVRRKRAEIAGENQIGSPRERETDTEPEYRDVAEMLNEARTALALAAPGADPAR